MPETKRKIKFPSKVKTILIGATAGYLMGSVIESYHHPFEETRLKTQIMAAVADGNAWGPDAHPEFYKAKKHLYIDEEKHQMAGIQTIDGKVGLGYFRQDGSVMLSPGEHIFENFKGETLSIVEKITSWYHDLRRGDNP